MSPYLVGLLGIAVALALLIFMAFRGFSLLLATPAVSAKTHTAPARAASASAFCSAFARKSECRMSRLESHQVKLGNRLF
jgi:hypothetical protein